MRWISPEERTNERERERRMTSFLPQCLLRIGIKKREKRKWRGKRTKKIHTNWLIRPEREREREIEDILVCTLILAYDTSGIIDTHTHNVGTSGLGDGVWVSYSSWLRRRRESDEGQGEKRWSICCWQRKRFKKIKKYKNKNKKRAGTTAARHAPSQATTFWVSVGPVWAEGSHPEAFTLYLLHFTAKKLSSNPTYGRPDKLPWHSHTRCPFYLFLFIFWNKKKEKKKFHETLKSTFLHCPKQLQI